VRREVVSRQDTGEFVVPEPLEVARGRQVSGTTPPPGQGAIGDLADQCLYECILPSLRRPRIDLEHQELAADENPQARPKLAFVRARHSGECRDSE
jgi:hypothetical protein